MTETTTPTPPDHDHDHVYLQICEALKRDSVPELRVRSASWPIEDLCRVITLIRQDPRVPSVVRQNTVTRQVGP